MRLETFFEKFAGLTETPDATGGIRELLIQLAVRGKLVSQDLRESAESQLRLASHFRVRKDGAARTSPENIPFSIPENWKWVAIGDTMELINGKAFKSEEWSTEGTPIIRIQNLNNEDASFNRCKIDVNPKIHVDNGEFLISWSGTPGTSFGAFIWNRGFAYLNQHIFRCELVPGIFVKEFLRLAVNARLDEMISHAQGGVGLRHITKGKLENIHLPLPPLAEQIRIVAKVDELMVLCGCLKTQQKEREMLHAALRRAAVARFNEAPNPVNLNFLFHNSYSISPADLRESILNLAVQGKLVPHCLDDELASVLLSEIEIDRERRRNEEGVRLPRDIPPLAPEHYPSDIPDSWKWVRLGQIALRIDYGTSQKAGDDTSLVPVYRMGNIATGRLIDENLKYVSPDIGDLPTLYLQTDDILFNRTNSFELVGKTAIYKGKPNSATFASYLIRVRLNGALLCPDFFNLVMNAPYFRETQIEPEITQQCGQANFNGTKLSLTAVPVPPLSEQRKIVAKVQQLMILVDQLEEQLAASKAKASELLDAVIHELLHLGTEASKPPTKVRPVTANRYDIGCYTIKHMLQNPNFGRTMLMKVFYLSEAHSGISQGWEPMRQAAGPYDPAIEDFESLGVQSGWFNLKKKTLSNGHEMVQYKAKSGLEAKIDEAISVLGGQKTEFDRLLNLFQNKTTEEAEIIATLFAAWNDLLIDGKSPSDDEIIREVRENWHYKKERFTPTLLTRWLNWLRQQSVIPRGLAPRTRQQLKLGLS